jgi:hypothetical protein
VGELMPVAEGSALTAFDRLEAVLPGMKSTISRVMPQVSQILDDEVDVDAFDDQRLLRELRALHRAALTVTASCNVLGAGDPLESELEVF